MPVRMITVRTPASVAGRVSRFPRDADLGEEVVAGRALLGEDLVAAVAVVPDRRRRHEHLRLALPARDRAREHRGAAHAAVADALLLLVGPALLADALAREVHDRVDTFERGRVDAPRVRDPSRSRRRR